MNVSKHQELTGKLWDIANRLRGPYRPPQYRLVMLPIIVLRRFDCVLEPTKDKVRAEYERLKAAQMPEQAMVSLLTIRLMAHLIYTGEKEVYTPGIYRTIYDPACGTGGMLSVSPAPDDGSERWLTFAPPCGWFLLRR